MPGLRASSKPPLRAVFDALLGHFGPQRWWPARTRFEMMVGAILTQNTAWTNVERAIANLRRAHVLAPDRMHRLPLRMLADLIRPAGYFNVKARRLRAFTGWLMEAWGGRMDPMLKSEGTALRRQLLAVHGIGPETADSILLYAAGRPFFVVDAYTRRVLRRHGWRAGHPPYDDVARLFTRRLPWDAALYNEYHALLVALGKEYCRARPRCEECPLRRFLPAEGPRA